MIATIVVVCFTIVLAVGLFCFIAGWKSGRANFEKEAAEEIARKAADKQFYENEKSKIKKEVFENVKNKKNKMLGNSGRDKFNAVNDVLRNKN